MDVRKVMDARNMLAGLMVLVCGSLLMAGTAVAHKTPWKVKGSTSTSLCVVHSLPAFLDQGYGNEASSVADIIEVECNPTYAERSGAFVGEQKDVEPGALAEDRASAARLWSVSCRLAGVDEARAL